VQADSLNFFLFEITTDDISTMPTPITNDSTKKKIQYDPRLLQE
jgi:hypothetical protein